jgi:probable H4MPT-linked C1 transfer pathway protein
MVAVLGLDIGGANTKAAYLATKNGNVAEYKSALEYFPFWKRGSEQLCQMLSKIRGKVAGSAGLDCVAVTLTAELSDAYRTKREGVHHILNCVSHVFRGIDVLVLDADAGLRSVEAAKAEPLKVAAANWAATGWMVAQHLPNCVVVDVGSTSTSIIPIQNGAVAAEGKTDLEKLINGELVYTGSLRTNVAAIVSSIPVRGGTARISSELFAQSGDVHLLLGNVAPENYTAETADGKGKTPSDAVARLARVVCADVEMLSEQEIYTIAVTVYREQVKQIAEALNQVYSRWKGNPKRTIPAVVTGLGREFLARKAAEKAGIAKILSIEDVLPAGTALGSPSVGVALMAATKLEGRSITWTP